MKTGANLTQQNRISLGREWTAQAGRRNDQVTSRPTKESAYDFEVEN